MELVRVRGTERALWLVIGAVAAIVALAVLKPWGTPAPAAGRLPAPSVPAANAETPAAARPSAGLEHCFNDDAWRLVTVERARERLMRSWIAVDPGVASGPRDTRIESVRIVGRQVVGLGFCAPVEVARAMDPADAVLWIPAGGRPARVALGELRPLRGFSPGAGRGEVYRAPGSAPTRSGWPEGRYVFEIRGAAPTGGSLWFAFELVAAPPVPTPTPRATR